MCKTRWKLTFFLLFLCKTYSTTTTTKKHVSNVFDQMVYVKKNSIPRALDIIVYKIKTGKQFFSSVRYVYLKCYGYISTLRYSPIGFAIEILQRDRFTIYSHVLN